MSKLPMVSIPASIVLLLIAACAPSSNYTQEQNVIPTDDLATEIPAELTSPLRAMADVTSGTPVTCATIPTQDEINTTTGTYQDYYMSAKRAASLGIPIINASGATDYLVIIRDYRRYKPCTATDGKTVLHYGQVIRAVIELSEYDASTKLAMPSLAASITLSGKQQYFYLYRTGWYNPKVDSILAEVSGKVFNVENYALYQGVMPRLIELVSAISTTLSAQEILRIPPEDDPSFVMASARAYGLAQAKDGKSCVDASRKFVADPGRAAAVVDVYAFLGKPQCTAERIVEPEKSRAARLLGPLSVK